MANQVDEIVDGIAIRFDSDTESFFDARIAACCYDQPYRYVNGYRQAGKNIWAVRIYERHGDRDVFSGGLVLGLGEAWTHNDAREIALRWLKGDDSVLGDQAHRRQVPRQAPAVDHTGAS